MADDAGVLFPLGVLLLRDVDNFDAGDVRRISQAVLAFGNDDAPAGRQMPLRPPPKLLVAGLLHEILSVDVEAVVELLELRLDALIGEEGFLSRTMVGAQQQCGEDKTEDELAGTLHC